MSKYDYLIVGSGLSGAVFCHEMVKAGKRCLVLEKRNRVGGNIVTENKDGIDIHMYGAHIFHTDNEEVWKFVNKITGFNHYVNSPIANYHGKLYNLPFNMNTFYQLWGVTTPQEAINKIQEERSELEGKEITNLEDKAISLVGRTVYETLIKEYTEKQWHTSCKNLPPFIIERLPVRFTYDNNYFNHPYQGIPNTGYNYIIEKLLKDTEVILNTDFIEFRKSNDVNEIADKIFYTGPIDEYYDYKFGVLGYLGLEFDTKKIMVNNFQGVAVVNHTSHDVPYTRSIEHKHFVFDSIHNDRGLTYVTYETPQEWKLGMERYYPINNTEYNTMYKKYSDYAEHASPNVIFGGRFGLYKYLDMHLVIESSLKLAKCELF